MTKKTDAKYKNFVVFNRQKNVKSQIRVTPDNCVFHLAMISVFNMVQLEMMKGQVHDTL